MQGEQWGCGAGGAQAHPKGWPLPRSEPLWPGVAGETLSCQVPPAVRAPEPWLSGEPPRLSS